MADLLIETIEEGILRAGGVVETEPPTVIDAVEKLNETLGTLKDGLDNVKGAYVYRGTVETAQQLPSSGLHTGDVYNIIEESSYGAAGQNVAWNGSGWDSLGSTLNISPASSENDGLMSSSDFTKLSNIENGADVNVVTTIKVNGTALVPDENKAVDITDAGGATLDLGLLNAEIDDVAQVAAVDDNGKPIAWKVDERLRNIMSMIQGVIDYIRYGVRQLTDDAWDYIAGLANYGEHALDILPVGTEIYDQWVDSHGSTDVTYDVPWLILGTDKAMLESGIVPVDVLWTGWKYTLPFGTEFDAREAFYAVPAGGLAADTYYVTWGTTWGENIVSGDSFSFTTTASHPEGAQLVFSGDANSSAVTTLKVYIYDTCGGTTKAEECVISAGIASGATQLCTLANAVIGENDAHNHLHRAVRGNSRWDQSAIRQYLNSDLPGGTWWQPQNKWDRPPSYVNYDGFMMGLSNELKAVIKKTKIVTALSYAADGGTASEPETVTTYDYFILLSWEQHWLKVENNYGVQTGLEGNPFSYWKKISGVTTPWAADTTHEEYIHYDLANHNTARYVFLRSAYRSTGIYVAYIYSSGCCGNGSASSGHYVLPVCAIQKAIA